MIWKETVTDVNVNNGTKLRNVPFLLLCWIHFGYKTFLHSGLGVGLRLFWDSNQINWIWQNGTRKKEQHEFQRIKSNRHTLLVSYYLLLLARISVSRRRKINLQRRGEKLQWYISAGVPGLFSLALPLNEIYRRQCTVPTTFLFCIVTEMLKLATLDDSTAELCNVASNAVY